ncbi:MAG: M4 family metallopeptidase [Bacteroidetes bacterium]|nr:M4 family metallopeptidase [Bacteroidota bacterium]
MGKKLLLATWVVLSTHWLGGQVMPKEMRHPVLGTFSYYAFDGEKQPEFTAWQAVLNRLSGETGLNWKIYSQITDELGQTHYRAQQYLGSHSVDLATVILHTQNGKILSVNGDIVPSAKLGGKQSLSEREALTKALAYFPSEKYYWNDPEQNAILQYSSGNPDTSYYPKAILTYIPSELNLANPHRLAWKFRIFSSEPLFGKEVYVDAENGELLATNELILHADSKGTAVTKYSGTRTITTDSLTPTSFRLREKARGNGIETYNLNKGTSYGSATDFTDADNNWNNVNANKDEIATDAHWGAEMTWDYYKTEHSRNSFDNNNAKILSYVHYSSNYDNAFWNGSVMTYGDGSSFKPLTSIDVCGHEVTHAVTTYTANLVYSYESGQLNESFSDIFGNAIENWARPTQWSWKIGEDITFSGAGLRNMSNPNLQGHPKFYKGVSWYSGAGDNGGVHLNSGVQNYWFYLITDGVSGTNEKGWAFKIDTLGFTKAGKIAYRTLSVYLTKNSQYADARTYHIMSAMDLYGQCSKEVIAVTNAWWVCGVGPKYDSGYVKAAFVGDTIACTLGKVISFSNQSENFKTVKWYFGDGNTSTLINPTNTYNSFGSFTVKLVANSCFKSKSDSLVRTAYVKVDSTFDICKGVFMPKNGTDSSNQCKGFIYDDGGDGLYKALVQTNLKIRVPGADSIRFRFLLLDYENGFDSVVLFKNSIAWANKIGRFTGSATPFGGAWQSFAGNTLWLRHYSDPMLEGKGFKIEYFAVRKPLTLEIGNDTTICYGDSLQLKPVYGGGYIPNHIFKWNTGASNPSIFVHPLTKTGYSMVMTDVCTGKFIKDTITVDVRQPLSVSARKDTIVCSGRSVSLTAKGSGGLTFAHTFTWDNGLGAGAIKSVTPATTTTYRVILSDGCTPSNDTAYVTVYVKPKLKTTVSSSSTLLCIGQTVNLTVTGSGGDTAGYTYTWNNGLGTGTSKSTSVTDTTLYIVTLTDGCSVQPAKDTAAVRTWPALKVAVSNDTTICRGSNININSIVLGGKGSGYVYTWTSGQSTSSISVSPAVPTWYKLTLGDNCSPSVSDSMQVTLLSPLSLSKLNDTILCDGQTWTPILTPAGGRVSSHSINWNVGGISGYSPTLSPPTGTTNYIAVLSDACTVKNDTTRFKIQKLPPLSAGISITPATICMGDSVTIKITHTGGKTANHSWTVDGVATTWTNQRIQPSISKSYNLILSDGCSVQSSATASVNISAAASAVLSVDKKAVCLGDPVQFNYASPDAAKVTWYFGGADSANGTGMPLTKTFPSAGKYLGTARVTTSAGCTQLFAMIDTVTVVNYPKAFFTAVPAVTTIENPIITFNNGTTGATGYSWSFGDGNTSTAAGNGQNAYTDTGWFTVSLTADIAPGCTNTYTSKVRIKDVYHLFLPTAFTPDENGKNDYYIPKGRAIASFHMTLYDRWGAKVFESRDMNKGWYGVDDKGTAMRTGVYIVRVEVIDTEGFRHVEKGSFTLLR